MSFRQKKSHYDYHPLPREQGEPDAMETVKLLPQAPREKLLKLFEEGTLREGDLDHKSVLTLQQLSEPLQHKVIEYLQTERLFLFNSRSKAGFLVSACDRAKKGELDARGFGALDPWRAQLQAESLPKPNFTLVPESEWKSRSDDDKIMLKVEFDGNTHEISVGQMEPISSIKDRVYSCLSSPEFSRSRLKLSHPWYGSLRNERTPAYYNLTEGLSLSIKIKTRGGLKIVKRT